MARHRGRPLRPLLALVVLGVLAGASWVAEWRDQAAPAAPVPRAEAPPAVAPEAAAARLRQAFDERTSGLMVSASGTVVRTLPDDREGSRHQRFVLELPDGLTLLVAHNIDLAPRVPLEAGDRVELRGQYEWNAQGGVVHWTHHDPDGQHEPGWILHEGRRFE